MNVSLYQAASALNANTRWQEVIAENLGASSVPGFKKQSITIDAVNAGLLPTNALQPTGGTSQFVLPRATVATDFSQGNIQYTGENTDLAIEGSGFFEVQLPDGRLGYTRDGQFHIDGQNRLVTKRGFPLLGENGPIQLDPNAGGAMADSLAVSPDGEVSQGGEARGRLRVVEFNHPQRLSQGGGGIFLAGAPGLLEIDTPTSSVRQRSVEMANSSGTAEMATLMTAMRTFEANQRAIQLQDERMGKVISELTPA